MNQEWNFCSNSAFYQPVKQANSILKFQVSWDGLTRVYVTSEPRWINQFEGMCGNFNLDPSDDMRTYGGEVTTSQIEFGNRLDLFLHPIAARLQGHQT